MLDFYIFIVTFKIKIYGNRIELVARDASEFLLHQLVMRELRNVSLNATDMLDVLFRFFFFSSDQTKLL